LDTIDVEDVKPDEERAQKIAETMNRRQNHTFNQVRRRQQGPKQAD